MTDVILSDAKPLGTVIHYFYRIEFQQRGSPHAHGVLWIKDAPHPEKNSPNDIATFVDKYVTCSLPSETDPVLFDLPDGGLPFGTKLSIFIKYC